MPDQPPEDQSDAFAGTPYHPSESEGVIEQVVSGQVSPAEAAEILQIPIGLVLRRSRERSSLDNSGKPQDKDISGDHSDRFVKNWGDAHEIAEPEPEELRTVDALVQEFAITRWLFSTDRRRVATALVACTMLVVGVFYLATRKAEPVSASAHAGSDKSPVSELPTAVDRQRAIDAARSYLAADTWMKKSKFIWDPEPTRKLMADWYDERKMPLTSEPEPSLHLAAESVREGIKYVFFQHRHDRASESIIPVRIGDNNAKVLWQATANYPPMDWHDFASERPAGAVDFRLRAKLVEAPKVFADSGFLFFELTPPEANPVPILGAVEEGSKVAVNLNVLTEFGENTGKGTFRVQFSESAPEGCVEITSVERSDWLN